MLSFWWTVSCGFLLCLACLCCIIHDSICKFRVVRFAEHFCLLQKVLESICLVHTSLCLQMKMVVYSSFRCHLHWGDDCKNLDLKFPLKKIEDTDCSTILSITFFPTDSNWCTLTSVSAKTPFTIFSKVESWEKGALQASYVINFSRSRLSLLSLVYAISLCCLLVVKVILILLSLALPFVTVWPKLRF